MDQEIRRGEECNLSSSMSKDLNLPHIELEEWKSHDPCSRGPEPNKGTLKEEETGEPGGEPMSTHD